MAFDQYGDDATYLVPSQALSPIFWDALNALGIRFTAQPILYDPGQMAEYVNCNDG